MSFMEHNKENLNTKNNNIITYILIVVVSAILIFIGYNICKVDITAEQQEDVYTAKIYEIYDTVLDEFSLDEGKTTITNKTIYFGAELTNGDRKGDIIYASQYIDTMYVSQPKEVEVGDNIIAIKLVDPGTSEITWQYVEHNRVNYLIVLGIVFFLIIIVMGRSKGIGTIISLAFTAAAIFLVYVPSILKGYNIYITTTIISLFIVFMSLLIINGVNKKTLCAILGNIGGVAVAGILALIMNSILNISGIIDDDYAFLVLLNENNPIDMRAIIWGSIVIGSLGAIMDVAMSIASSMNELSETMENKSFSKMLKSGMNIGKDAIGTMTNTLILAYIGGSLATVLLLVSNNKNILYLFNLEMIVVEILQAIVGSMGILFAVPVTAIFAAYIFNKKKIVKNNKAKINHEEKILIDETNKE